MDMMVFHSTHVLNSKDEDNAAEILKEKMH